MKIVNIGILAHVDAGKTSLTEAVLHQAGAIKNLGSVDKGTSVTDSLDIEKKRGISIKSNSVCFNLNDTQINWIDTPGHADFSSEVENALSIIDLGILIVSAVEGLQSHTYNIINALQKLSIPYIIFINKTDRAGSDFNSRIKELNSEFDSTFVPINYILNEADNEINSEDIRVGESIPDYFRTEVLEQLAELDDDLMEKYVDDIPIENHYLSKIIDNLIKTNEIVPIISGSVKFNIGVDILLDIIRLYDFKKEQTNVMSALIYKTVYDKELGKLSYIRMFGGEIKARNTIWNETQQKEEKITLIKKRFTDKLQDITALKQNDIGIICGLKTSYTGDVLGKSDFVPQQYKMDIPPLLVQVKALDDKDYSILAEALQILNEEDPNLDFYWYKPEKELTIKIKGKVHQEILMDELITRFGIEAQFEEPTVIFKETPLKKAEGFVRYWMPKPCWAVMKFIIEPGEINSGVQYESQVSVNDIKQKYQNEVERSIPKVLKQGIKGWEVTDIKITLVEGEDHEVHSRPGDFAIATPMGIMRALESAGTKLLEPYIAFTIVTSEDFMGKIIGELTNLEAQLDAPEMFNEKFKLQGVIPYSNAMELPAQINSLSSGKAVLRMKFDSYRECFADRKIIRNYKGVNPLDESKWILHARGAYKADERDL